MDTSDHIAHTGIVTAKEGEKAVIYVMQDGACHSCHMSGFCGVEDSDRSRFEVSDSHLAVGDHVNIQISPGSGYKATFWAYFFPFILMLLVVILGKVFGISEGLSGALALILLIPYYLILALFKEKISHQVHLQITKL